MNPHNHPHTIPLKSPAQDALRLPLTFYRVRVIETETAPVSGTDGPLLMRNTSGEHTRPRVFPSAPRRRGSAAAD